MAQGLEKMRAKSEEGKKRADEIKRAEAAEAEEWAQAARESAQPEAPAPVPARSQEGPKPTVPEFKCSVCETKLGTSVLVEGKVKFMGIFTFEGKRYCDVHARAARDKQWEKRK